MKATALAKWRDAIRQHPLMMYYYIVWNGLEIYDTDVITAESLMLMTNMSAIDAIRNINEYYDAVDEREEDQQRAFLAKLVQLIDKTRLCNLSCRLISQIYDELNEAKSMYIRDLDY